MSYLYFAFSGLLAIFLGCNSSNKSESKSNDSQSNAISKWQDTIALKEGPLDTILNLPELSAMLKLVHDLYPKNRICSMVESEPYSGFPYYWVQIGNLSTERFEPLLNFYIKSDSYEVLYYDIINDTIIPLQKARTIIEKRLH